MNTFYKKLILFAAIFASCYFFLVHKVALSNTDLYYPKFTEQAGSLILGVSRAHNGISPEIISKQLDSGSLGLPLVNFAFNKYISSFGDTYTQAIKRKLTKESRDHLFIISISPGNFTAPRNLDSEGVNDLDNKMSLGQVDNLSTYPNYEYIMDTYEQPLYTAFFPNRFSNQTIHPDGWFETKVMTSSHTIPDSDMRHWKMLTLRENARLLKKEEISEVRKTSFYNMVSELRDMGKVVLIRMPVDEEIIRMENEFWPNFSTEFQNFSNESNIPFFDYTVYSANYKYYDGSHMVSESAKRFSSELAKDIARYLKVSE